jgi:hypothetical protein
LDHG